MPATRSPCSARRRCCGTGAGRSRAAGPRAHEVRDWCGSVVRIEENRFLVAVSATLLPESGSSSPPVPAGRRQHRLANGWTFRAGLPLRDRSDPRAVVPQMANFERIGGVSFTRAVTRAGNCRSHPVSGQGQAISTALPASAAMQAGDELFSDGACRTRPAAWWFPAPPAGGHEALAVLMETAVAAGVHLRARDGDRVRRHRSPPDAPGLAAAPCA